MLASLGGCGFELPPASHVTQTQIAVVRPSVVELGPLDPARVGPKLAYADEIPIAEVLPGDRLLLDTVVIDADGVTLPADEVETLWLQCGAGPCQRTAAGYASAAFDVPCDTLSVLSTYTMDSYCRLGTGNAQFEFVVPELDYNIVMDPRMRLYGIVAWDGRRVEDCWAERRGNRANFEGCGFIYQNITVGPQWWLLQYSESLGYYTGEDHPPIPDVLLDQAANRVPRAPELAITVDGEPTIEGRPPLDTVPVQPGALIEIVITFDVTSQLLQGTFSPLAEDEQTYGYSPELVFAWTLTTNAIQPDGPVGPLPDGGRFRYRVDPDAAPGISRVLIVYRDIRNAGDIRTVEFEVE